MDWKPVNFVGVDDPMVNAVLNVAAGLHAVAEAQTKLLYALKYSEREGMSVAEAIETCGKSIAEGMESVSRSVGELQPPA